MALDPEGEDSGGDEGDAGEAALLEPITDCSVLSDMHLQVTNIMKVVSTWEFAINKYTEAIANELSDYKIELAIFASSVEEKLFLDSQPEVTTVITMKRYSAIKDQYEELRNITRDLLPNKAAKTGAASSSGTTSSRS